ncbi:30S ribosomal protein S3 [Lagierella sp. ICN-221743]
MGQKVNPHGLRVGVIKDWSSKWFADKKDFADLLVEDNEIRKLVKKEVYLAGVSEIKIERASNKIKVTIETAKPGMVIGRQGAGVEVLRNKLEKLTDKQVIINVEEVKRPDLDAQLVAESIAASLERRVSFRRAMKQAIQRSMRAGAKGIKTSVSGRVGGADMARTEGYSEGTIPLQTLRADISYGFAEADTTYGKLGVKVWIYKGQVLPGMKEAEVPEVKDNRRKNKRNRKQNPKRNNRGQSENK